MSVEINTLNTLAYDPERCNGCGMCSRVCPHGVFSPNGRTVQLLQPEACIECGACQRNCPTAAIAVDSGVGCAAALIWAALTGREAACGDADSDRDGASCCEPSVNS